jgi:hypothetical protein
MTANRKTLLAFPEAGTIRKGAPKPQGKPGADLNDRFRVVVSPGMDDIRDAFLKVYQTETPTRIRAMIPFPKVSDAWAWQNEAYQAGRMVAQAVDDRFLVYRDPLTGVYEVRDGEPFMAYTPGQHIVYERDGKRFDLPMKPSGRLRLWLPELGRMVFFTLKTTSFYDCQNISQNLAAVQGIADALNHGNAAGIPLWIYRKKQSITWNKPDGTATRIDKWLVQVEVDPAYVQTAIARMSDFALTGGQGLGQLPAGDLAGTEDPDVEEEEEEPTPGPSLKGREEDDWKSLIQDGDFRPETQAHPPIEPPVVDRTPEPAVRSEPAAPVSPLDAAKSLLASAPHEGKNLVRPMAPEVVRAALVVKAASYAGRSISPKQTGLAAMLLEQIYSEHDSPKKIRYSVTQYLFGCESLNDLTAGSVLALLDWLKPVQAASGEYLVDDTTAKEASNLYAAACREAGQLEFPI